MSLDKCVSFGLHLPKLKNGQKRKKMKILKRIGIVLGVLIVIWLIMAVFAPASAHVERTTIVNAPSNVVYDQVNNFHNWKSWSYWDNIDKVTMKDSFSGPEAG